MVLFYDGQTPRPMDVSAVRGRKTMTDNICDLGGEMLRVRKDKGIVD